MPGRLPGDVRLRSAPGAMSSRVRCAPRAAADRVWPWSRCCVAVVTGG